MIHLIGPLFLAAALAGTGVYGMLARRNAILVLIGAELLLNAAGIVLITAGTLPDGGLAKLDSLAATEASAPVDPMLSGQVLTIFLITIAAAEIGLALAVVLVYFRTHNTVDLSVGTVPKRSDSPWGPPTGPGGLVTTAATTMRRYFVPGPLTGGDGSLPVSLRATPSGAQAAPVRPVEGSSAEPVAVRPARRVPVAEVPVVPPVAEPVAQPVAEVPVVPPVAEPVARPVAEPVAQPAVEPVAQPMAEPLAQPVVAAPNVEASPAPEPEVEVVAEPVAEPAPPWWDVETPSLFTPQVEPQAAPEPESPVGPASTPTATKPSADPSAQSAGTSPTRSTRSKGQESPEAGAVRPEPAEGDDISDWIADLKASMADDETEQDGER